MIDNNSVLRPSITMTQGKSAKDFRPLVLAFVGDSIYEVYVRNYVILGSSINVNQLHNKAVKFVKAVNQARAIKEMIKREILTQDEIGIFKRGRNQFNQTLPRSASAVEYKMATGFESLVGYLYLDKDFERLEVIVNAAISIIEEIE